MKHNLMTVTAALGLALFALPAAAQGPRMMGRGGPGGFDGSRRLDFLAGYLSLTETQKTQAKTIFDSAATASETARGSLTGAHEAVRAAVKAGSPDAEIDRLAAAVGTIQGQLVAINAKAEKAFYAILTAEQKTKYDSLRERGPRGPGGE
jgi:Spy/CpxP family protein refolding chaperone